MNEDNTLLTGIEFAKAAKDAGTYLGDFQAVSDLIRAFIASEAEAMVEGDEALVMQIADAEALRFAGRMDGFTPIRDWAVHEQLGIYIAKHWGVDANATIVDALRGMFMKAVGQIADIIVDSHNGEAESQTRFRIDVLVEELAATLTGTWEVVFPPEDDD